MAVFDFAGVLAATWRGYDPVSVTGRVRYVRRGGCDTTPGAWREPGGGLVPVTVVLDGSDRHLDGRAEGNAFRVPLAALTPLGTLDYPLRPRATASDGTELKSGLVVRTGDRVASLLLLRKSDVAVVAVLQGWPSPTELSHGQNADEITGATG